MDVGISTISVDALADRLVIGGVASGILSALFNSAWIFARFRDGVTITMIGTFLVDFTLRYLHIS